ncbi:S-layer homology domain-containing protein [Paenibacillus alba]|uniref:S-layer homology domain-containing protein n=1 Tax=Paenibacillus alba TaxID=1197127 RepID=A0ABU6G0Y7_9BACL|nr:S-layer homology domain-containing protein [Paenibacillus alba]MEC0227826.1 S-layer homology domain-containing protein [Paenibacillus alba]
MSTKNLLRVLSITPLTFSLLVPALPATMVQAAPQTQVTANPTSSAGKWMTGEFHAHTFESDDAQSSLESVLDNAFDKYGLDWIATANHLRSSKRDDEGVDVPGGPIPFSQGAINYEVPKIKALQAAGKYEGKTIFSGFEWDIPKHDHAAIGILTDTPGSAEALKAANQFEYLFTDRPEDLFDDNDLEIWKQKDTKITNFNHADALAAIKWLQKNYADKSYFFVTHPSRGKNGSIPKTTIADLRDFNNAAPNINFGFEGMLGNQMEPDRGGFNTTYNIDNPTADENYKLRSYGGSDYMIAKVGGVWDALLGEGRNYWNFANSDYHFKTIGANSSGYWPGEYAKNYTWTNGSDMQSVVDGMRSGKSFSVFGDLINALDFNIEGNGAKLEMGAANPQVTMKEGDHLQLTIRFKSPQTNNYEVPVVNGSPANLAPKVDHIDLIAGDVSDEKAEPGTGAYDKDTNDSTKVIASFTNSDWTTDEEGYNVIHYDLGAAKKNQYFRLRGTNLGKNVPGETDAEGNPLLDPKTNDADDNTRFNNINDRNYKDLWFYSNPIFVKPAPYSDEQAVDDTIHKLVIANANEVSTDIALPLAGEHGTTIQWKSSVPSLISNDGKLLAVPANNTMLDLVATIQRGNTSKTRTFPVIVKGINKAVIELHGTMTKADGQSYTSGTWTNQSVNVSVYANVYAPSTSAAIKVSSDSGETYIPYEQNSQILVSEAGAHDLLFKGTDNLNNELTLQLKVNIDKEAPVIALIGNPSIVLRRGSSYSEQGAKATDNVEVAGDVAITGVVDTNLSGSYTLHYNVKDAAGNAAAEVVRTVTVYEESSGSNHSSPQPAPTPEIKEPSQTVQVDVKAGQDAEGSLKDVVKFKIPAKALAADSKINVSVVDASQAPSVGTLEALSPVVEFTSSVGHTFDKPLEITFNYKMGSSKAKNPAVYYYNESQKKWIFIGGTPHSDGTISVNVKHFTKFAVFNYEPTLLVDLKGHWASVYTDRLIGMKAIQGYEDYTFHPEQTVTRAQFASMLVKTLGLQGLESSTKFADDSQIPAWAKADIAAAVKAGILSGYEVDGKSAFKAEQTITRAEMSMMIANALKAVPSKAVDGLKPFQDASSIPAWAQSSVSAAVTAGILSGYEDNTFRANNLATRAEAAAMIYKLLDSLNI